MKRRTFIKGAISAAVAASLPASEYTYKTYKTATATIHPIPHEMGERMARALAESMMQTKEAVTANVFNKAFINPTRLNVPFDLSSVIDEVLDDSKPLSRTFGVTDDSEVHRS